MHPKKLLGQNFLVDRNLLRVVADAAEIGEEDIVLEIGAGTGSLTEIIAERAKAVIAVEKDDALFEIARGSLAPLANVEVVHADIMGEDSAINPQIIQALRAKKSRRLRVVGDLPYYISTPLITALLTSPLRFKLMALTVQREVAERLAAPPKTKEYGFLSVLVQLTAEVRLVKKLPPHVFWPRPKIWSALLTIRPRLSPREIKAMLPNVQRLTSALFHQRRKDAAKALVAAGFASSKDEAAAILVEAGAPATAKADALAPQQIKYIAEKSVER